MRKFSRILPCVFMLAVCGWSQTKSDIDAKSGVEINLLADSSLKDWTRVAIPPTAPLAAASPWRVDASTGVLICDGDKAGHEWLRYNHEYGSFIVHVEWRFTKIEGDRKYNSGVFIRNSVDGTIWHQAQIGSASGGYLFGDTFVNGVKQRVNLSKQLKTNQVKEAGEWNTFEIRAEGRDIKLYVNGAETSDFADCEVARGYVGLEAEGYRIEFRDVKLKELP